MKKLSKFLELSPRVELLYSMMDENRKRLYKTLEDISQEELDFTPNSENFETIGTLLFHIAGVEYSWVFEDINGQEMSFEKWKYAFPLRDEVNLEQLTSKPVEYYIDKLEVVRKKIYEKFMTFSDQDLENVVGEESQYTIEWIIFHLIEHELVHIGQISFLRRLYSLKCQQRNSNEKE